MTLYQPVVEKLKYSLWRGKWVQDTLYPAIAIFDSMVKAEAYRDEYIEALREGLNLKEGNFRFYIAKLQKY